MYAAIPGRNKFRPQQRTPIPNFTLAGDWTSQKFLGSMEGAVLGGKLAAEVIMDKAMGVSPKEDKKIQDRCCAYVSCDCVLCVFVGLLPTDLLLFGTSLHSGSTL